MSYKGKVQERLRASEERSEERMELWEEVGAAYEGGGLEQVESMLAEKMEGLKDRFGEAIDKLQRML